VLAISPDGSRIAFLEGTIGKGPLYVRDLESDTPRELDGTTGASSPFFSPDGRWIGYFSPGKLRKVSVDGGRPIDLADRTSTAAPPGAPTARSSSRPTRPPGCSAFRPAAAAAAVTELDVAHGERTHRWPRVLPGGREVAFTVGTRVGPATTKTRPSSAVDLATGKRRPLIRGASMVRFTATGHAARPRRSGAGDAARAAHGQVAEDATQVLRASPACRRAESCTSTSRATARWSTPSATQSIEELDIAWFSRTGEAQPLPVPRVQYRVLRFSPDGRRVAIAAGPGAAAAATSRSSTRRAARSRN
jgi:serine/threonine-protein kinase